MSDPLLTADGAARDVSIAVESPVPSDVEALFLRTRAPDPAYAHEVAHAKRLCERFHADHRFRAAMARDPEAALQAAGIDGSAEAYRPLYDPVAWQAHLANPSSSSRPVRRLLAFNDEKAAWRSALRSDLHVAHPGLHAWRRRQIQRCHGQLPNGNADFIVHAPVSFELCRGCSVGCWFCGISAGRLSEVWRYEDHRDEWRGVLGVVADIVGSAGRLGFCYWGTDPFDNPDYERFCEDHHDILGAFPHTTTALAHRDVERTRLLLRRSRERGCKLNRFSVLSLSILDQLHEAFTADELLFVDLALQNTQSLGGKTRAGKVLARAQRAERILAEDAAEEGDSAAAQAAGRSALPASRAATIACVSGFQLNLIDRRVRLISPCPADARWPDGFRVHAEAHYESVDDLRETLQQMISPQTLRVFVGASDEVRLRHDVTVQMNGDDLLLHSPFRILSLPGARHPYNAALAEALKRSTTLGALALEVEQKCGASLDQIFSVINNLHSLGLLEDDPSTGTSSTTSKAPEVARA